MREMAAADKAPASRMAARLADLSHAQLLEIAAAGCEASTQVKNRADALLAAHKPLVQQAVEGVLLSSDLVPHLLAPLQLEDGAAAAVCSRWADGWKATSEGRRRLTQVALDFPQESQHLLGGRAEEFEMAVIPGGNEHLVVNCDTAVDILARDMSIVRFFELPTSPGSGPIAASERFLYIAANGNKGLHCLTYDGTEVASYASPAKRISHPVLGPEGLLFCLLYAHDTAHDTQDEIIVLDARTLQPLHWFGLSLLHGVRAMVVVGEELFVACDDDYGRLQVFSLAGEHRRSITGEWKWPAKLCFVKDRFYLLEAPLERAGDAASDEAHLLNPLQGRRIFVLSLQGDTLQVYTHPAPLRPPGPFVEPLTFRNICYFDGKLLASIQNEWSDLCVGVLALGGC